MTGLETGSVALAILCVLLALGVPVAFAMGVVAAGGLYIAIGPTFLLSTVQSLPYAIASNYDFVVVPMFVLMGIVASKAGIIGDLYTAAYRFTSALRGSLLTATVISQAIFAAVSGSTVVAASVFAKMALPEMLRYRYDPGLSAATIAAAGTLAGLIPPSLVFVLYAVLTGEPVGKLLIAGLIPGLFTALAYILGIRVLLAFRPELAPQVIERFTWRDKTRALGPVWAIALLIGIVLGGLYAGWFPPSAAGAVGAAGAVLIALAMRRIGGRDIWEALIESARIAAMLFLIVIAGLLLSRYLLISGFISDIRTIVIDSGLGIYGFLALISVVYIILGIFIDEVSLLVVTVPFVYPVAQALGVDGVWLGVIVVKLIAIAAISPPIGLTLYAVLAACGSQVTSRQLFMGTIPFLVIEMFVLAALIAFPALSLWLPAAMGE